MRDPAQLPEQEVTRAGMTDVRAPFFETRQAAWSVLHGSAFLSLTALLLRHFFSYATLVTQRELRGERANIERARARRV